MDGPVAVALHGWPMASAVIRWQIRLVQKVLALDVER